MGKQKRKRNPREVSSPAEAERPGWIVRVQRHSLLVFAGLVAVASLRIAATYTVFNHTIDEPAHIACGMEWLDKGVYRYEPQHPPLARVAAALGPYLVGRRTHGAGNMYQEGALILYLDKHYDRNLALARLAILPFFWIACAVVYIWARRYFGEPAAALSVFLFTFLPPILAHAGLATTDMAVTAFMGASFLSGIFWVETPSWRRAAVFGACTGLAVLSKFSCLLFLPAGFLAALICYCAGARPGVSRLFGLVRSRVATLTLAAAVAMLLIWAGYRFSFGKFAGFTLPAPELFAGIKQMLDHNAHGHPAYLLGMRSKTGWWYYYPVVLAVKTPLAFLSLLFAGGLVCWRNRSQAAYWLPAAFSLGILCAALFSQINIGVRHILVVYMGFSVMAALGALRLLELSRAARWAAWTLGVLLVWHGATSALSHPDYIPYTNALAGNQPEKVLVDSDLDWGQDMKRLGRRLRELGARQVTFNPLIIAYLEAAHGFPPIQPMAPEAPSPGWNAASLTVMLAGRLGLGDEHPEIRLWTDGFKPLERVGKSTYLWYFPPAGGPRL
jgi:4-amino-4-deoxy-L-arabinose transferase-like glycosyltransferase